MFAIDRDKTFAQYSIDDWQQLHRGAWAWGCAELQAGQQLYESYVVLRDIYGRPDVQKLELAKLRHRLWAAEDGTPKMGRRGELRFLAAALREFNAIAYIVLAEAWARRATGRAAMEAMQQERWGGFASQPDRIEVLTVGLVTRDGGPRFVQGGYIKRLGGAEDGPVIAIDESKVATMSEGALLDLFTPENL